MQINLKNEHTMQTRQVKLGYSWTFFFFGWWVSLFRGDWKWWAITFLISIILGMFTYGTALFIFQVVFAAFYNKLYIQDLKGQGFEAADEFSSRAMSANGL